VLGYIIQGVSSRVYNFLPPILFTYTYYSKREGEFCDIRISWSKPAGVGGDKEQIVLKPKITKNKNI
jgi:hypothetical protein